MQKVAYVPVTINTCIFQQSQPQKVDQFQSINLNQPNAFRNMSITNRRQEQQGNQNDRRKSVDLSIYQNRNNPPQILYQFVKPIQQYQQQPQIYQIQTREQSFDQHRQNNQSFSGQMQNMSYQENSQIQNPNFTYNQCGTTQIYQNNTQQIISFPQQAIQNHTIKQPDSCSMRYNLIPHSNNNDSMRLHVESLSNQQRDLKQINYNSQNRRYSIDSGTVQVDKNKGIYGFYTKNNQNNVFNNEQPLNTNSSTSTYNPQTRFINIVGQQTKVPSFTKDQQSNQISTDRYFNASLNGSFSNNSTTNQYQDTNKLNSSLNSSFSHDHNYVKPRSNSLAVQQKFEQQYFTQPTNLIVQNQIQQPYVSIQQNQYQNYENKYLVQSPISNKNITNQLQTQNLKILQTNINYQNQQTPAMQNEQRQIKQEYLQQNPSENISYFSKTMQKDSNNSQRFIDEDVMVDLNVNNQGSNEKNRMIHIKSVELLQSTEKKIQQKNEQFEISENNNINNMKGLYNISRQQSNSSKNPKLNIQLQQSEEKENIYLRSPQILTNNSVIIEYNEVYKQDRIPITHGANKDSTTNNQINSSIKQQQPKYNCFQTTDLLHQPLSKLNSSKKQIPHNNLTDVKNLVDQQVQQIQKECKERLNQLGQQNHSVKYEGKDYFSEKYKNKKQDDAQKGESLNVNSFYQNIDTPINQTERLKVFNTNIRTPLNEQNKQSNQQIEQNDTSFRFNIKSDQDRTLQSERGYKLMSKYSGEQKYNVLNKNQEKQTESYFENRIGPENIKILRNEQFQDGQEQLKHIIGNKDNDIRQETSIKNNKSILQYPIPPSTEQNGKTAYFHKKNICKTGEIFTFNSNQSSTQTQGSIDINNSNCQDIKYIKPCFRKINNLMSKSPIDQICRNQQQIHEVPEISSSYLFQNEIINNQQNQKNLQENNGQLENLEESHKRILNIHEQYQNGITNYSKFTRKPKIYDLEDKNQQKTTNIHQNLQEKISTLNQNRNKQFKSESVDSNKLTNQFQTNTLVGEKQIFMEEKVLHTQNKSISIQGHSIQNEKIQDQKHEKQQIQGQNQLKSINSSNQKQFFKIDEKITEDYADSLYWQLNIERSLLQLKTGLGRKMNEVELILPQLQKETNELGEEKQKSEDLLKYGIRLNEILGTNYQVDEFKQIFSSNKCKDVQDECFQQIKKEEILEVLLGIQNLTVTQKTFEINEETKKIIRNIMKETLRAETNFNEIRQRFFQYQNQLFSHISNGNNDIITYSDFKSFFIKNGYQVRDQEMMLLINRFHKPNTIRLNLQQFIMN